MGTDIHGWIEINRGDEWISVVNIEPIVSRHYDMFACLFGVMNYANFKPIAPERGLPIDMSLIVSRDTLEYENDLLFPTWITWDELRAIDWSELGTKADERVHQYAKQADGQLNFVSKSVYPNSHTLNFELESSWEADGVIYKIEKISRAEALTEDPGWLFLFNIMEFLAKQFSQSQVRLVVWFAR